MSKLPTPIKPANQEIILPHSHDNKQSLQKTGNYPVPSKLIYLNDLKETSSTQKLSMGISIACLLLAVIVFAISKQKDDNAALQLAMQQQAQMASMMGEMTDTIKQLKTEKQQPVIVERGPTVMGFPIFSFFPFAIPVMGAAPQAVQPAYEPAPNRRTMQRTAPPNLPKRHSSKPQASSQQAPQANPHTQLIEKTAAEYSNLLK